MNLREMISMVSSVLGDPGEDDLQRGEIIQYLSVGQHVVGRTLVNVEREKFLTTNTQAAVSAQELYNTPADLQDIVRVTYDGTECARMPVIELAAIDRNTNYRAIKGVQQFFYERGGTVGLTQIGIRPIPDGTENIIIYYVRRPLDFHALGTYNGTVTANAGTSTTQFEDDAAPFAGTASKTGKDDFWNDAEIRWTGGNNTGIRVRVSDFQENPSGVIYGRFIMTEAMPNAPVATETYELDQVSIIPEQHHEMICFYAAGIAAPKVGMSGAQYIQMVRDEMALLEKKYLANVEAHVVGDRS